MNKLTAITLSVALGAGLAACGQQGEAPKAEEKAAMADDAGTMAMPTEARHAKGMASVTAIDTAKGQVTLDHGEIAELDWPPMSMGFAAKPDLLNDIKVGDKVAFEFDWDGQAGTVTKLDKAS